VKRTTDASAVTAWIDRAKRNDPILEDLASVFFRKRAKPDNIKSLLKDFSGWPWGDDKQEVARDEKKLSGWGKETLEEIALALDVVEGRNKDGKDAIVSKLVEFCKKPKEGMHTSVKPSGARARQENSKAGSGTKGKETNADKLARLKKERTKLDEQIKKLESAASASSGSKKRKASSEPESRKQPASKSQRTSSSAQKTESKQTKGAAKASNAKGGSSRGKAATTQSKRKR